MNEAWLWLESPPARAAANMAVDEVLLRTAAERRQPLLRVYSWLRPAISIGYFQNFPAHLADQYDIVRRPTGGGLVYHGDDTTYTVVAPPNHALARMNTADAYRAIHRAVAAALGARAHEIVAGRPLPHNDVGAIRAYDCFQNPVLGDVMADGRKLAGGAQRRNRHGVLHQGSIASRITAEQFVDGFSAELGARFEPYALTREERALAERLAREKYATVRWNQRVF